jgi:hypothetical protein
MEWLDEIRGATDDLSFALLDAIEEMPESLRPDAADDPGDDRPVD